MSETLYTYRRFRRPDGSEAYERVPYDSRAPVLEPPVLMPKVSEKQCAGPRNPSAAVDNILNRMAAKEAQVLIAATNEAKPKQVPLCATDVSWSLDRTFAHGCARTTALRLI